MTEADAHLFRLALIELEEAMNEVITRYFEDHAITDGGEEIISLVCRAMSERTEEVVRGGRDALLASWRHRSSIN